VRICLAVRRIVDKEKSGAGGIASLFDTAPPDAGLALAIERAIDPERGVKDDASPRLAGLFRSQRAERERVVSELEHLQRVLGDESVSPEATITLRNGRYVLPVLVRSRNRVPGIIHDKSRTGQTLFVEPNAVVELNNELREIEIEIERERERILAELSTRAVGGREELRDAYRSLLRFDSLAARARCAEAWDCTEPLVGSDIPLKIIGGKHPLLLKRALESGRPDTVVPLTLEFEAGERTVLVSGPNAGGKTVMLKTVGILVAMTLCGLHIPARKGTCIPLPRGLFVDIGDQQSIENDLSTFSSHVVRLVEILESAGPGSLVLLDEIGVGTDPVEGVAIARAVLEELTERDARTIATTHYGQLKALADRERRIVNGSLSFDPERLVPTFRFSKGLPGRSMGLAIGTRFGMPPSLIEKARSYADGGGMALEDLLGELEILRERLSREAGHMAEETRRHARAARELEEEKIRTEKEKVETLNAAREESREAYLKARRELEQAIANLSGSSDREAVVKEARRALETGLAGITRPAAKSARQPQAFTPRVGDTVLLPDLRRTGRVVSLMPERGEVEVEAAGKSLRIPVGEVAPLPNSESPETGAQERKGDRIDMDIDESSDTLDIRGMRRDEVKYEVSRAIDGAVLGGLRILKIIHGKGDGILRDEVQRILAGEKRVTQFRMGRPWEGGSGVTIAEVTE
jgi:DNA mismatch repair protein MutS2